MIIGSGLLAQAFSPAFALRDDICIFAAGVSNSGCNDFQEFTRERERLGYALQQAENIDAFVYFGTCSVADPESQTSPYVLHKVAMEKLVHTHKRNLIFRLPQVVGKTPNQYTLLNFLHAKILRSEPFNLWRNAKRNIIDVIDVAIIAEQLIANSLMRNTILNIANLENYPMAEIVTQMEHVVGKRAVYKAVERGSDYYIDTNPILPVLEKVNIKFDNGYLEKVIAAYY